MVVASPNPTRTALHNENLPDGPLTKRQRAFCDAVRGCHSLADFTAVPRACNTSVEVASIPYGMSHETAAVFVRRGIAEARARLDHLERVLNAYGGGAFSPQSYGVPAVGITGTTRHEVLTAILRRVGGDLLIRVGDTPVEPEPQGGGYRLISDGRARIEA